MQEKERHYNNFDIFHYLERNDNHESLGLKDFIIKTKAYYLIKYDQVYGNLLVFNDYL